MRSGACQGPLGATQFPTLVHAGFTLSSQAINSQAGTISMRRPHAESECGVSAVKSKNVMTRLCLLESVN